LKKIFLCLLLFITIGLTSCGNPDARTGKVSSEPPYKDEITVMHIEAENDDFEIKLNVDAFIPKEYISSDADKIDFYKRLNSVITDEEIDSIVEDLIDRFSDFGTEVTNLIDICYLKVKAKESRVTSVKELANKVIVTFEKDIVNKLKGKELFAALMPHKDVRIIAKDGFFLEIDKKERYSIRRIRDMINLVKENMEETNDKD